MTRTKEGIRQRCGRESGASFRDRESERRRELERVLPEDGLAEHYKDEEGKHKNIEQRWTEMLMKQGNKWMVIGDHGGEMPGSQE